MIPELGQLCLVLALLLALVQGTVPLAGAASGSAALMGLARPAARAHFAFLAAAFAALAYSFWVNDFSVKTVAHNSFSQLPVAYRLTATWGAHEGSMLLWVLTLAGWASALTLVSPRRLAEDQAARALGVLGLVSTGLTAFVLFTSNPFARLSPVPPDGADLNPLLQDWGMILHPPMLYLGYVGFSVTFAFALAALIAGRLDADWARQARPWAAAAWACLTAGIGLGSWWAYRELGWGGWWFWDPTENASLMPWLAGTALLHSLAVTSRRGGQVTWSLFLAIAAFSLSLLGTFLIRSGVLSSVHAFATDPSRGLFILSLLALVIGGSLALYAWRQPRGPAPAEAGFHWAARESLLLGNNLLLAAALGTVMLGTLYPLALDVLGLGKVSVGAPYFNAMFVPLMAPVLFLMGLGPLARWQREAPLRLLLRLRWAGTAALALTAALVWGQGGLSPLASLGVALGLWVLLATLTAALTQGGPGLARWGMLVAHAGLGVLVLGITLVSALSAERDLRMEPGDHLDLGGYRFVLSAVNPAAGPNYVADRATVEVTGADGVTHTLYPERRKYNASRIGMTEAGIDSGPLRDLYCSMGEYLGGQAWSLRLHVKPFVSWLWAGAGLMVLGGLLAALGRARVRESDRAPAPAVRGVPA